MSDGDSIEVTVYKVEDVDEDGPTIAPTKVTRGEKETGGEKKAGKKVPMWICYSPIIHVLSEVSSGAYLGCCRRPLVLLVKR